MAEEIGETCLYKDGESKNFIGNGIADAMKSGWKDTPQPKSEKKEPQIKTSKGK